MNAGSNYQFLRRALLLDLVASVLTAGLLFLAFEPLSELLGFPTRTILSAAAILVPWCVLVAWASSYKRAPMALVWLIVALNGVWVAASALLLLSGFVSPTQFGIGFVTFQASAVVGFACLQVIGLAKATAVAQAD